MAEKIVISDYFSKVSHNYISFRPSYPLEIFQFLSQFTSSHKLALDVATGSGQAACNLAEYFQQVVATDASSNQLLQAVEKPNVKYLCLPAEMTKGQCDQNGFQPSSFDVITCATAIHWLDHQLFFDVAKSLLKPEGIMAIFSYSGLQFGDASLDAILPAYEESIRPLLPLSTKSFGEEGYKDLYFPFDHVAASWDANAQQFSINVSYSLDDMQGLMHSFSSTQVATEKWGYDPSIAVLDKFRSLWGTDERRPVRLPIYYRIGRNRH